MRQLAILVVLAGGCIDAPTVEPPDESGATATTRWPGWCVAKSEFNGVEGRRVAIYDDNDRLVSDEFDSDVDGEPDVITSYYYDDSARLIRLEIDRFANQVVDEVRHYEWSDDGRMIRESWDTDADAEADVVITFDHDDEGNRIRGTGRLDEDGVPEIAFRFEWDAGLLMEVHIDGFAGRVDGIFERAIFYGYDDAGNLTHAFFDFDANGVADMIVTYSYDCWDDAPN